MGLKRIAGACARVARDSWLIIGIAIVIVLGLEITYRAQRGIRLALSSPEKIEAQEANVPWISAYETEFAAASDLRWVPYVYFRRIPFNGAFINVDSTGRRRTVTGGATVASGPKVFFFGGSTMFGTYQRDQATIPSLVSRILLDQWGIAIRPTNFGETGYVFSTEVIAFFRELQGGNNPDVVVFYDGINDVASAVQNGTAALPQNELNRVRDWEFGKRLFARPAGLSHDLLAGRALLTAGAKQIQFIRPLRRRSFRRATQSERSDSALAIEILEANSRTARVATSMAEGVRAKTLFYWQPTIHTTEKRLSPFESRMLEQMISDPYHSQFLNLHRLIAARLEAPPSPQEYAPLRSLSRIFSGDTLPVFADMIGHTYERANEAIAQVIARDIARLLQPQGGTGARRRPD